MHSYRSIPHTLLLNKVERYRSFEKCNAKSTIILQALFPKKPKYAKEILYQIYIFDTTTADIILQEAYIANALVNFWGLLSMFNKIDLLLEHKNRKFKCFQANRVLSLQETDEMFWLYALSVDSLLKIQEIMKKVIIGNKQSKKHLTKNTSFDIKSLAYQLYCSWSTILNGLEPGKIYFSEKSYLDFWNEGLQ